MLFILFSLIIPLIVLYLFPKYKEWRRYHILLNKLPAHSGEKFLIGHLGMFMKPPAEQFKMRRKLARDNLHLVAAVICIGPIKAVTMYFPEDIELVVSNTKHNKKTSIYGFLHSWLGDGLLLSDGHKWQTRRKILTPAFHFSILQQFIEVFNKETNVMVEKLYKEVDKPYVDIKPLISELTLHSINETSMGSRLDQTTKEGRQYLESVHEIGHIFYKRFISIWVVFYNFLYHNLSSLGIKEKRVINILHNFTRTVIKKREETFEKFTVLEDETKDESYSSRKRLTFLDLLLNAKVKEGNIDDQGILDEVNTVMFAAHDTTATNLIFCMILLACHKNHQDEIYEEILQVVGKDKPPTYADLQKLHVMERCIKESLRLYPSVPFIGRELSEDVESSVGTLPKGCQVYIQVYDMHRNPRVWTDPDKFDPDRFLPENCKNRHPYQYIPFSAGPRNCIGQKYAMFEIKAVLVGVLRQFKLEPVDTPDTIDIMQDIVIRPFRGAKVKFALRDSKEIKDIC